MSKINEEYIKNLSYTDFLGLVNQWNVPPGAYETVNKWVKFSNMNQNSQVLEIACSTGFSLRECAGLTKCSGIGIDISAKSVEIANKNKMKYSPNLNITYLNEDGYKFATKEKFSHIVVGAALRFFDNPKKMIERCASDLWREQGYLLSCEFYTPNPVPENLIQEAYKVFNIRITSAPYKKVMSVYEGLELLYEDRKVPELETDKELDYYCRSTINRAVEDLGLKESNIYETLYKRLYEIKMMSNKLREYQKYNILVHRFRSELYPNRYVELF